MEQQKTRLIQYQAKNNQGVFHGRIAYTYTALGIFIGYAKLILSNNYIHQNQNTMKITTKIVVN